MKRYKTTARHRERQKEYRLARQEKDLCLTSEKHGQATHGVLCERCREVHRRSS